MSLYRHATLHIILAAVQLVQLHRRRDSALVVTLFPISLLLRRRLRFILSSAAWQPLGSGTSGLYTRLPHPRHPRLPAISSRTPALSHRLDTQHRWVSYRRWHSYPIVGGIRSPSPEASSQAERAAHPILPVYILSRLDPSTS
ncbi:hypothetical protein C8Q77DRAFT_199600 [Trametes polyzona]|nr:hypothetical protein C8Q77DRAFT_199600 [Trametes polyzona]